MSLFLIILILFFEFLSLLISGTPLNSLDIRDQDIFQGLKASLSIVT